MDKKYKVVGICGKSASGKDTLQKAMCKDGDFNPIISSTTRPRREHEVHGEDYYYLDKETLLEKILDGTMLEVTSFEVEPDVNWFYGTAIEALSLDKINIGVFNPEGLENLSEDSRIELYTIYLDASPKIRLLRSLNREENPNVNEIVRRYLADEKDFDGIEEKVDMSIVNDGANDVQTIADALKKYLFSTLQI